MRVLVTGVKGQLGHDVMDELAAKGIEGIGVDVEEMDITDAAACEKVITEAKPDAVIHCAAYTAVDAAEDNLELCRKVKTPILADQVVKDAVESQVKDLVGGTITPEQAAAKVVEKTKLYLTE